MLPEDEILSTIDVTNNGISFVELNRIPSYIGNLKRQEKKPRDFL